PDFLRESKGFRKSRLARYFWQRAREINTDLRQEEPLFSAKMRKESATSATNAINMRIRSKRLEFLAELYHQPRLFRKLFLGAECQLCYLGDRTFCLLSPTGGSGRGGWWG